MSIETNYSINFIAAMALREKQIQQNYRPIIAVHKWFARRPGTLFRGLLLSEFADRPIEESYYEANDFPGVSIADPFMGGGTPLLEANRLGCNVIGLDINPMATWIVREEIAALDLPAYLRSATQLTDELKRRIGHLYKTECPITGRRDADVKYFLWVKTSDCTSCGKTFDLFPGYVIAEDTRHPSHILVCSECGDLNEVENLEHPGECQCGNELKATGSVRRNKCGCPHCGHINEAPFGNGHPPHHRLFAIEYHNPELKDRPGRLFKKPDSADLARVTETKSLLQELKPSFIPDDMIPEGDESSRLHRWGYNHFFELFNDRQLLGLETSARLISNNKDARIKRALATNFSDLLRYQNMLCRYDTMALKSLDIFSIHGFPVGYVQVESNILGIRNGNSLPVGSGGWVNIIDKYAKAKRYCTEPFEVMFQGKKKIIVPMPKEWIGERHPERLDARSRAVDVRCASATEVELPPESLDAVFTDPPYYGNVQYGELMQFCYVWLRKLMGRDSPGLENDTTRHANELTGNATAARGISHFTEGMAAAYSNMARALKPGAPLVFTYHHNRADAYHAIGVAILDAGLTCSASIPCPAEMGGSIHIHGTNSSIVDTVFVCRDRGSTPRRWLFVDSEGLARIIARDLAELRIAGMKPTSGDIRCIALGHLTRMTIWNLRSTWSKNASTELKLEAFRATMNSLGDLANLGMLLDSEPAPHAVAHSGLFASVNQGECNDAVAF